MFSFPGFSQPWPLKDESATQFSPSATSEVIILFHAQDIILTTKILDCCYNLNETVLNSRISTVINHSFVIYEKASCTTK
jgi:hypothetical protein